MSGGSVSKKRKFLSPNRISELVYDSESEDAATSSESTSEDKGDFQDEQCYNFHKIQQENTKWTGAVVYMRCFTVSFSLWAPCKGVYYTSLGARGPCPLLT
jgi:malate synthase